MNMSANTVFLVLTSEEASHLHDMLWLLKGSQYPDNNWPKSVDTLEKKINTMVTAKITKKTKREDWPSDEDWPIDY